MSLSDEIERLQSLNETGALSDEEFGQAKANLLNNKSGVPDFQVPGGAAKWWMVALHLSQFAAPPGTWKSGKPGLLFNKFALA